MSGAIALALDIDPRAKSVVTYSGDRMDTVYLLVDGEWECRDARSTRKATTPTTKESTP